MGSNKKQISGRSSAIAAPKRPSSLKKALQIEAQEKLFTKPVYIIIAVCVLISAAVVVWLTPRKIGDLFIGLAGGRDVVNGKLGAPDDWSFLTEGKIWVNQNWGTHLIFYLVQQLLGYHGLVLLKSVLIALCALFAVLSARNRGIPLNISMITAGAVILSSWSFIDLRPNLMSFVLGPLVLWLIYRSHERCYRIWFAVLALIIWSNTHGSFIFGLGMISLWAACFIIISYIKDGIWTSIKRYWQLAAGAAVSILLAGLTSPFGFVNLTHFFIVAESKYWREVPEWLPIWVEKGFGSTWEFITIMLFMVMLLSFRLMSTQTETTKKSSKHRLVKDNHLEIRIFDMILVSVAVIMAANSRRFIPLAMLISLPVIASQIWWLVRTTRLRMISIILSCILFIFSGVKLYNTIQYYYYTQYKDSVFKNSVFEKMHFLGNGFPVELSGFINDNNISGNVMSDWTWEGFLHWYCPQLKVAIGGRAQQVYDEKTSILFSAAVFGPSFHEVSNRGDINMIAVANSPVYKNLMDLAMSEKKWVIVFVNESSILLVDYHWPAGRDIVEQVVNNRAAYKDAITAQKSMDACKQTLSRIQ